MLAVFTKRGIFIHAVYMRFSEYGKKRGELDQATFVYHYLFVVLIILNQFGFTKSTQKNKIKGYNNSDYT